MFFRTEKCNDDDEGVQDISASDKDGDVASPPPATEDKAAPVIKHIVTVFGIATIGLAIWGAVLTFPNAQEYFDKENGHDDNCPNSVFIAGIVSAAIPIAIIAGMIMYFGVKAILGKGKGQSDRQETASGEYAEGQEAPEHDGV